MRTYYIGPVEKRSGKWGWFRGFAETDAQPVFVAYGYITTKREAIERREVDIQAILGRGDKVVFLTVELNPQTKDIRGELAAYISTNRPDLAEEVEDCMTEL